jgi:hypothetical protein
MPTKFDVAQVIKDLGGAQRIVEELAKHGVTDMSAKAVEKWRERGTIPMKRWLQIRKLKKVTDGKALELEDYIIQNHNR